MNLERISEALQNYTGQEESMRAVAAILQEELGDNWTTTVFDDLQGLPPALKDNLTHVFNYYAATMAWNEIQGYLMDDNLKDTPELRERLPVLSHWLNFFGAPGQEAYQELEDRLNTMNDEPISVGTDSDGGDIGTDGTVSDEALTESNDEVVEDEISEPSEEQDSSEEITAPPMKRGELEDSQDESSEPVNSKEENPSDSELEAASEEVKPDEEQDVVENEEPEVPKDSPEAFEIEKLTKQLALLDQNQAWLAARCIQLKDIEIYAYPFYGYIVDMMRQIMKSIEAIEANEEALSLLDALFEGGKTAFDNKKQAIEHDIELAEQNCESAATALISDDMDMDEVRRTLGTIDESDNVEYVGPAPDGFELLDDETPLDETAIKKQYEKLENIDALTGNKAEEVEDVAEEITENASQKQQKGVQRKLSFSLKRKKPTEDAS